MKNLTHHQERILNQLLGKFGKTDHLEDFKRILQIYFDILLKEDDKLIMSTFYKIIENKLYFVIQKDFKFYSLEYYKEKYYEQLQDFLEDIPDSIEIDFIEKCIKDQKSILDNTIKFNYQLKDYSPIDVLTLVREDFLDEYKSTSKRKIEFLQAKLNESNLASNSQLNPYSFIFVSREVYDNFRKYTSSYIIDFFIDYSYLKKRLEDESLIHKTTDREFMKFIFEELKLITESRYRIFLVENKLRSLKKSYSTQRENNFNIVFGIE
jgi:hypothetical protein